MVSCVHEGIIHRFDLFCFESKWLCREYLVEIRINGSRGERCCSGYIRRLSRPAVYVALMSTIVVRSIKHIAKESRWRLLSLRPNESFFLEHCWRQSVPEHTEKTHPSYGFVTTEETKSGKRWDRFLYPKRQLTGTNVTEWTWDKPERDSDWICLNKDVPMHISKVRASLY